MSDDPHERSPGAPLRLRSFTPEHLDAVLAIERASFPSDPYPERLFLLLARHDPDLFLVAESDSRVIGYAVGAVEEEPSGRIVSIAVEPASRRGGVARALADELMRRLDAVGVASIHLEVRVDNRAGIALWRRLGFVPVGVLPSYYGDGTDALAMRRG